MFNVLLLGLASFLTDVSSEMVYPLLPLYLTSARIGATPLIVGLIEGIAESLASLLRVFAGYWSDRIGRRKSLTIAGYSSSLFGKVLLYLSMNWPLVLMGRIVDRFGKGVRTAPRDALIAESVTAETRGNAFGLHRALDTAGAAVGVALAYVLFTSVHEEFTSIFLLSLIPAGLGVILLFWIREKKSSQPRTIRPRPSFAGLAAQWKELDPRLQRFILIVFLFNLGNSSNQFLLLRATSLGYSDAQAILLYLVYNLSYAVVSWPAGRLSDRIGRKQLLVAGYGIYGLIYLGFGITTAGTLLPLFLLYGLYIAMTEGVEKALVADLTPQNIRATLMGLHATAVGLGLLPASLLAGFLWSTFGATAPFLFGGFLGVAAAVSLALFI